MLTVVDLSKNSTTKKRILNLLFNSSHRWRYYDNLQAINGSMKWQEDYLAFNLLADYLFKTNEFFGEINAIVNSSIPTLPRAAAIAKHRVVWKKSADTLLSFQVNLGILL